MVEYYIGKNIPVVANTDIMAENYIPKFGLEDITIMCIYVVPQDSGILSFNRIYDDADHIEILNADNALIAGCAYMFTILLSDEEVNIRYSVDTTFDYIQLREEF